MPDLSNGDLTRGDLVEAALAAQGLGANPFAGGGSVAPPSWHDVALSYGPRLMFDFSEDMTVNGSYEVTALSNRGSADATYASTSGTSGTYALGIEGTLRSSDGRCFISKQGTKYSNQHCFAVASFPEGAFPGTQAYMNLFGSANNSQPYAVWFDDTKDEWMGNNFTGSGGSRPTADGTTKYIVEARAVNGKCPAEGIWVNGTQVVASAGEFSMQGPALGNSGTRPSGRYFPAHFHAFLTYTGELEVYGHSAGRITPTAAAVVRAALAASYGITLP